MYASNEDEDWVYLHDTPPVHTIFQGTENLVDYEHFSSSSNSSSSKSDRSASLSSISSTELEPAQQDDDSNDSINHHGLEQENRLMETTSIEDPLLFSPPNNTQAIMDDNILSSSQRLISTSAMKEEEEEKEEIVPSEILIKGDDDNAIVELDTNTSPAISDEDVLNTGFDLSKTLSLTNTSESLSLPNDIRHRTEVHVQETCLYNSEVIQSTPISEHVRPQKRYEHRQRKSDKVIPCILMILLFTLPFILGQLLERRDQPMIKKIVEELDKTNQRLNAVKDLPMESIEEKLTKQFEEKLRNIINQQMAWHDHERYALNFQIHELHQLLNITQKNLTNTIHQLTNENGRLQEQIKSLEQRLEVSEKRYSKDTETCPEGGNCTKPSTLDILVTNIYKQTASIAEDTSDNLSGIFEQLSASVSDVVDQRHEYVEKSKQKLTDFTGSLAAEHVQTTFRRSVENISSSLRKAKSTYVTWLKCRAQRREQARLESNEKERQKQQQQQTPKKHPWRWTFQRSHDREQMRYQSSNKQHVCHSKFYFPVHQICSMKNWMVKFFRP